MHLHSAENAIAFEGHLRPFAFLLEAAHQQGAQQCSAHGCACCRCTFVPSTRLHATPGLAGAGKRHSEQM